MADGVQHKWVRKGELNSEQLIEELQNKKAIAEQLAKATDAQKAHQEASRQERMRELDRAHELEAQCVSALQALVVARGAAREQAVKHAGAKLIQHAQRAKSALQAKREVLQAQEALEEKKKLEEELAHLTNESELQQGIEEANRLRNAHAIAQAEEEARLLEAEEKARLAREQAQRLEELLQQNQAEMIAHEQQAKKEAEEACRVAFEIAQRRDIALMRATDEESARRARLMAEDEVRALDVKRQAEAQQKRAEEEARARQIAEEEAQKQNAAKERAMAVVQRIRQAKAKAEKLAKEEAIRQTRVAAEKAEKDAALANAAKELKFMEDFAKRLEALTAEHQELAKQCGHAWIEKVFKVQEEVRNAVESSFDQGAESPKKEALAPGESPQGSPLPLLLGSPLQLPQDSPVQSPQLQAPHPVPTSPPPAGQPSPVGEPSPAEQPSPAAQPPPVEQPIVFFPPMPAPPPPQKYRTTPSAFSMPGISAVIHPRPTFEEMQVLFEMERQKEKEAQEKLLKEEQDKLEKERQEQLAKEKIEREKKALQERARLAKLRMARQKAKAKPKPAAIQPAGLLGLPPQQTLPPQQSVPLLGSVSIASTYSLPPAMSLAGFPNPYGFSIPPPPASVQGFAPALLPEHFSVSRPSYAPQYSPAPFTPADTQLYLPAPQSAAPTFYHFPSYPAPPPFCQFAAPHFDFGGVQPFF